MSIKHSLLALLSEGATYGAQLRSEFEQRTGGTWPLNIGQVYTTLNRLQRDGLVQSDGNGDERMIEYRLTEAGDLAVAQWWRTPVGREQAPRNELMIKLALAVTVPGVDVSAIVNGQRAATVQSLQQFTRLKHSSLEASDRPRDLAWALLIENLIFTAEAELRWLDHVESRLLSHPPGPATPAREPISDRQPVER